MSKAEEDNTYSDALKLISQSQKILREIEEKEGNFSNIKNESKENCKKEKIKLEQEINSLKTKIHYLEKELEVCYFLNETWEDRFRKIPRKTADKKRHRRGGKKTRKRQRR